MPALASIVLALAAGLPGPGQIYGPPAPAPKTSRAALPGVGPEVRTIYKDIQDGREDGQLSRKQGKELRREASAIGDLERRFASDGLSESEQAELRNRTEVLRAVTNVKRSGTMK